MGIFADLPAHPFERIRSFDDLEFDSLIEMAGAIHKEYGVGPLWREDVVRSEFDKNGKNYCAVAVGDKQRIEGSMVLYLGNVWYNPDYWMVQDRWVYVRPEFRGNTQNLADLLGFARWYANEFLQIHLCVGIMSTERAAAKVRLFRKLLGVEPIGGSFLVERPN